MEITSEIIIDKKAKIRYNFNFETAQFEFRKKLLLIQNLSFFNLINNFEVTITL